MKFVFFPVVVVGFASLAVDSDRHSQQPTWLHGGLDTRSLVAGLI